MDDTTQMLYTELPVPLISTATLIRHQRQSARFQPYQNLHQPQLFHNNSIQDEYLRLQNNVSKEQASSPVDQGGTTHISCLYPEILSIIFSYLDVHDKGHVSQVCTAWRDAAYRKSVWKGTIAKLHLRRSNPSLFTSLVKRGIKHVQVLSTKRSLRDLIQGVPNLEYLSISGCYNITDQALGQAFTTEMLTLTELNLSLCKQITDNSLNRITQYFKNLEILELGGCYQVTNSSLLLIGWSLKKLKRLNIRSCWQVTDQGIHHLTQGNLELEHLSLQDCQRLSDDALRSITKLVRLKSLNLSFCVGITDSGLKYLAKMPSLQELNLRMCDNISDLGMAYLSEGGSRITSLDVSFCDKIGDLALVHISQGLYNLKSLSLSACQISDEGLRKVSSSLHDLETLNIGQCSKITDCGIIQLAESLTRLRYIDLYGCTLITTLGIQKVMKLPQLSSLNLEMSEVRNSQESLMYIKNIVRRNFAAGVEGIC